MSKRKRFAQETSHIFVYQRWQYTLKKKYGIDENITI